MAEDPKERKLRRLLEPATRAEMLELAVLQTEFSVGLVGWLQRMQDGEPASAEGMARLTSLIRDFIKTTREIIDGTDDDDKV